MIKRVISYLLILTTLLSVFCLPITAENTNETDIAASSLQDTSVADSKNASLPEVVTVAEEIKEKRGKFEKHYLLSDGTFMAISYAEAVHEQDEDGVWQEIDNTLSYDSQSGAYKASLNDGGKITFSGKEGKEYFYINAPFMYDSAGTGSTDIQVSLKQTGKTVTITYTPSKTWLENEERVYPVVFDPEVTTNAYCCNIIDTYVHVDDQTNNYNHDSASLRVGNGYISYLRISNLPYLGDLPIIRTDLTLNALSISSGLAGKKFRLEQIDGSKVNQFESATDINFTVVDEIDIDGSYVLTFNTTGIATLEAFSRVGTNELGYRLSCPDSQDDAVFASTEYDVDSMHPVFTVRYGYQNPKALLSDNPNDGDNRYWITDTTSVAYGRKMISTLGNELTLFSSQEPRGHFNFLAADAGMYIYGCYDMKYLSVPSNTYGTSIQFQSGLSNADSWIAIPLSDATYAFVLKDAPHLALTRNESNGVQIMPVNASIANSQEWLIYSEGALDATDSIDSYPLEVGTYYINSYTSREFLVNTSTSSIDRMALSAATVDQAGLQMEWKVSFVGNGKYMIQSLWNYKFLSVSGSGASLISIEDEDNIPLSSLFTITKTGDNYKLCSGEGYYLTTMSTGVGSSTGGSTVKWRLCSVDQYIEVESCQIRTLTFGNTETIPLQTNPSNASFNSISDFTFDSNSSLASISGTVITANSIGNFTLQAYHIPTGQVFSCAVSIEAIYIYLVSTPITIFDSNVPTEITGHSFLYFKNKTSQNVVLGHAVLQAGDNMSIGRFGQSYILPGYDTDNGCREGIWYNAEIKAYVNGNRFDDAVAVCNAITFSELATISQYICNAEITDDDDYGLFSNNCTHFASDVWNLVSDTPFEDIFTPVGLASEIEDTDGYLSNLEYHTFFEYYGYYYDNNEEMTWYIFPQLI